MTPSGDQASSATIDFGSQVTIVSSQLYMISLTSKVSWMRASVLIKNSK